MRYYIAGPMAGLPRFNFEAFDAARDLLIAEGHEVFSPADMDRDIGFDPDKDTPDKAFMEEAMRRDVLAIMQSDGIYMLPGWEKSKGARAEKALAEWRHIEVRYAEPVAENGDPKKAAGDKKCPFHLLPVVALEQTAWVQALGASKYGERNWATTGVALKTYHAAIMRHLFAAVSGEWIDPESGKPHIAHIAASCNILLDAHHLGKLEL